MNKLIALEWMKLRKRPLPWAWLIPLVLLAAATVLLTYLGGSAIDDRAGGTAGQGAQMARSMILRGATLPGAIISSMNFVAGFGALALGVIAALSVGNEYGWGTIRLMLTRGTGRINLWVSKIVIMLIFAFATALMAVLVGILSGLLVGTFPSGQAEEWLNGEGLTTILMQLGAGTLALWSFGLLGILAATFFRSPIAGVVATLGYIIVENIFLNPLLALAATQSGLLGGLSHIREYLVGNNTGALLHAANPHSWGTVSLSLVSISGWQALAYLLILCASCIGLSLWRIQTADVTE